MCGSLDRQSLQVLMYGEDIDRVRRGSVKDIYCHNNDKSQRKTRVQIIHFEDDEFE